MARLGDPGELERLQDEARRAARFVALAAHELRAPAAVLHGISTTLVERDGLDAAQTEVLHRLLHEHTGRLCLLMDQLLDLSRLDAEAVPIRRRRFPVRPRLEQLVASVAGERAREVELAVDSSLETAVDPDAFDRIVGNLVANALAHGEPPVVVQAEQLDRHFRLTVEDRGSGVAEEFAPRLFERFARDAREVAGSGLGLSIARQYAAAHGGEVLYEPASPRGARFRVVIPAPKPA